MNNLVIINFYEKINYSIKLISVFTRKIRKETISSNGSTMTKIFDSMDEDEQKFDKRLDKLANSKGIDVSSYSSGKGIRFAKDLKEMPTVIISVDNKGNLTTKTSSSSDFVLTDYIKELQLFQKQVLDILKDLSK